MAWNSLCRAGLLCSSVYLGSAEIRGLYHHSQLRAFFLNLSTCRILPIVLECVFLNDFIVFCNPAINWNLSGISLWSDLRVLIGEEHRYCFDLIVKNAYCCYDLILPLVLSLLYTPPLEWNYATQLPLNNLCILSLLESTVSSWSTPGRFHSALVYMFSYLTSMCVY